MVPKKARPSLKAGVAETCATNMANSSVVANATQVVQDCSNQNAAEEKNCTSRKKALAADKDLSHMAISSLMADATQVTEEKSKRRNRQKGRSKNSYGGDTVENRLQTKSLRMLVFSLASSVNLSGVAKDTEAVNVAPVSLVADALVVTCDARGKGKEAESKSGKSNHERLTCVNRPAKGLL